jgi:hemerythrin-like domain-containing protein
MLPVLNRLVSEHRHFNSLLRLVEKKAGQLARLQPGDLYLMRDVVDYLHDYPDDVHHPTEDVLFDSLRARRRSMAREIAQVHSDHRHIAAATSDVLARIDEAIDAPDASRLRALGAACAAFVQDQRAHMEFENSTLFPVALGTLRKSDWRRIEAQYLPTDDPLFGSSISSRHRLLYEFILDPPTSLADSRERSCPVTRAALAVCRKEARVAEFA